MPADPTLELQGAILARLKADAALTALIGGRVYDTVPPDAVFPYVTFGPVDDISDDADCIFGSQINVQIDAWSRAVGYPEVKRIAGAIRDALHETDAAMPLPVNALALFQHIQTRTFRDADGLTNHSVLDFQASVERRD